MGKGKEKGCFYSFIDDSYFAYYFLQWAIGFVVIGVILIIAGAVAGSLYPRGQYQQFSEKQQLLAGEGSDNFERWKLTRSIVTYTFNNVSRTSTGSITCTPVGPYIYDLTDTKVNILFSGDSSNVTYRIQQSKSLRTDSAPSLFLSLLNPKYVELVKYKQTEKTLFVEGFEESNFTTDHEGFFKNIAPNLIGARYFAQKLPASIKKVTEEVVFPLVFSDQTGLRKSINDYEQRFTVDKLLKLPCRFCLPGSNIGPGIYNNLLAAFINNAECRDGNLPDETTFKNSFIQNFANLDSDTECVNFLKTKGLDDPMWNSNGDLAILLLSYLKNTLQEGVSLWFDIEKPNELGFCNDYNSGADFFNTTSGFIQNFCEEFIPKWYDEVRSNAVLGFSSTELGKRAFCTGGKSDDAPLILPFLAKTVGQFFASTGVALNYTTTYNDADCVKFINILHDINGFIIPTYNGKATTYDGTLSAGEKTILTNYFNKHKAGFERYFINLWRASGYNCPSCEIRPLYEILTSFPDATVFGTETNLYNFFFPSTPSTLPLSFSFSDPKPILTFGKTIFSEITSAQGILVHMYRLEENAVRGFFNIDTTQLTALQNYAIAMVDRLLQTAIMTPNGLPSKSDVGMLQFAQAKLACGLNRPSERCSMASEFYGISLPYSAELGIASYVPTPPGYPESFTEADITVRDTSTATTAKSIFTELANATSVILKPETDLSRKYLHYLFSTFVFDFVSPSSTGLVATRTITEFLEGSEDSSVLQFGSGSNIAAFRSIDPSSTATVYVYNVETGAYDSNLAYTFNTINGSSSLNIFGENGKLTGLLNPDQLPPFGVKAGKTVNIFDPHLVRSFSFVFNDQLNEEKEVPFFSGTTPVSDWENPAYTSTPKYIAVPKSSNIEFFSPCGASLTDTCALGNEGSPNTIEVEPDTGLVISYSTCYVRSVSFSGTRFPISANGVSENSRFSVMERRFTREIDTELSASYVTMVNTTRNNATAILASLISVGCLFIAVAALFIVFYFIKSSRENIEKAKSDLVNDPFNEKNKSQIYLRD